TPARPPPPDPPTAPPTSAEQTLEKSSARKRPAPKSNGADASTKRVSPRLGDRQSVAQDTAAPARATRAGTKAAEAEKEKAVAPVKRAPRKSKGRH
ncbi:hypothetical protein FS749_013201, partial [Ceratobasidium sp. UAMH 11750]